MVTAYPNPFASSSTVKYRVTQASNVTINIFNESGKRVSTLLNRKEAPGTYSVQWNSGSLPKGIYFINASVNGQTVQTVKVTKQ